MEITPNLGLGLNGPLTTVTDAWQTDLNFQVIDEQFGVQMNEQLMNLAFFGLLSIGLPAVNVIDLGTF